MSFKYFPHTEDDLKAMMAKVGVNDLDGLYAQIPESIRFKGDYKIPCESEIGVRRLWCLRPLYTIGDSKFGATL